MLVFNALRTRQSINEGYFYAIFHIAIIVSHINRLTIVKMKAGVTFFFKVDTS